MIKISPATSELQLQKIESLAETIWREHYIPIIGKEQVAYMLENFQSLAAMQSQIDEGYFYYSVYKNQEMVGYFSIQKRDDAMFLSKLYLLKSHRGEGLGKASMDYIHQQSKALKCAKITLTVNRHNKNTIRAYEALGFKNIGEKVTDIGNGFVMDDYLLEKKL